MNIVSFHLSEDINIFCFSLASLFLIEAFHNFIMFKDVGRLRAVSACREERAC